MNKVVQRFSAYIRGLIFDSSLTQHLPRLVSARGLRPMRFYEKAREKRPSIHDPLVRPRRLAVIKSATVNLFLFQILFLGLFCYIFGSLFQQTTHIHNINILFVDYDGGAVGAAVRAAYQQLKAPGFPTLIERPAQVYPQPNIIKGAICDIEYWAALYTVSNASSRLTAALAGGAAASSYDKGEALAMVWNEARYPTVVDSVVKNSLTSLSGAARIAYANAGGQQLIQSLNASDSTARAVFANPWTLTSIDLQPTPQGSRLIYNTLVIILILMQDFCYLGCVNGLYQQFRLYTAVTPHRITIVRQIISVLYTFLGALCTAGAIWAFRSGWDVNGNQFVLTWMSLWLFGHLNFLVLDFFHCLGCACLCPHGTDILGHVECYFDPLAVRIIAGVLSMGSCVTSSLHLPDSH